MAVKASVTITISKYRDTDSITRYYKLQASTAAAPAVPTTLTPSGWSTSEPTYTSGSTNTLYYTDCVVFSDGTFQYTDDGNGKAVKSSSYEAAKEAYNKAQAAQNTANTTQENLDNLEVGNNNLLFNFYKPKANNTQWDNIVATSTDDLPQIDDVSFALRGSTLTSKYFVPYDKNKKYKIDMWFKCLNPTVNPTTYFYPSILPYDMDKNLISTIHIIMNTDKVTTLSEDLNSGDTIVHATNINSWPTDSSTPKSYIGIFNYKSSSGYEYNRYTRNILHYANHQESRENIIDKTNNTIKLKNAYNGPTIPAGTKIAHTSDGSTYIYPFAGIRRDSVANWVYKEKIFDSSFDARLLEATYVRIMPVVWQDTIWVCAPKMIDYTTQWEAEHSVKSITNLYYSSNSSTLPAKPTAHVTTNNTTTRNAWNIGLPTYDENYPYLYTCKEVLLNNGTYSWTTVNQTTYAEAIKTMQTELNAVQADYLKETTFTTYKREQIENDQGIKQRLSRTEVTVYGDPNNPDDPEALINHIQKVDNDINGSGGLDDRLEAAEGTIDGTGLNDYDQRVKITQRFLNVETDVESIKNIFKITGGTNLVQNSVGYFADNDNKPTMWNIAANTIYTPFGYDGDLTGITISRGRLFCAKGSVTTAPNNIVALLANKMMSISFKYKNGANATSKIKVFNGSVVYFEKTFNSAVNQWTEYTFNPDTDPVLANPSFLNTANSLQISIESTNSTNNNGFEISDLMLNYGDIKPWELSSNEVYGAMVKLSSLGIEVTATTAKTKNFMTTDGILVYQYDPQTDTIGNLITKITDNGTITNRLESTGDIVERDLIHTMIKDSSNNNVYVEYIR